MAVQKNGAAIKKLYHNGGQVKRWYHNGALVYRAAVTVANLLAAPTPVTLSWSDIGYADALEYGPAVALVRGHRYYIRASSATWGYSGGDGFAAKGTAQFLGSAIAASAANGSATAQQAEGHAILAANAATANLVAGVLRNNSTQGSTTASFLLLCDLAELEAARGAQYTADGFWAACGGRAFYGSREFDL